MAREREKIEGLTYQSADLWVRRIPKGIKMRCTCHILPHTFAALANWDLRCCINIF